MTFRQRLSQIALTLLVVLTIASITNIHSVVYALHGMGRSWLENVLVPWAIAVGFGAGFSLLIYIIMVSKARSTKVTATTFGIIFGLVSGIIQTQVYVEASTIIAYAFGFGVPFFEAAIAIVDSLLRAEEASHPADHSTISSEIHNRSEASHSTTPQTPISTAVQSARQTARDQAEASYSNPIPKHPKSTPPHTSNHSEASPTTMPSKLANLPHHQEEASPTTGAQERSNSPTNGHSNGHNSSPSFLHQEEALSSKPSPSTSKTPPVSSEASPSTDEKSPSGLKKTPKSHEKGSSDDETSDLSSDLSSDLTRPEQVKILLANNPDITPQALASHFGVTTKTARSYLRQATS